MSYPPPPPTPSSGGAVAGSAARQEAAQPQEGHHPFHTSPNRQQSTHQSGHPFQSQSPTDHIEASAAVAQAAVAAAHHGLQALQQASTKLPAANGPPANQSYPPLASPPLESQYPIPPAPGGLQVDQKPLPPKVTRLRRACDLCSARKVKCDEAGPPCRPCRDLNIECTFNRAMKRRGPPNKHAEAAKSAKQPRLEPTFHPSLQPHPQLHQSSNFHPQAQLQPSMSPNPRNAAETLVSIAGREPASGLDGESIAPWPVVSLLVQDFFTYIHPLAPFPHEPTFMTSFRNREDRTSREFLALLASMIGALVASFPRTARLHLKNQQSSNLFPRAITMIERCRTVALEARGSHFMDKEDVTVYDAATSYFLGLAAGYTMQWKLYRRFMTECLCFVREMGYHKRRDLGSSMYGVTYRGPAFDHVQDQLGKRIFWVMFLGIRSMAQLGTAHSEIILPPFTHSEPAPDYPVEVDDQYILPHQILGQPEGTVSLLTGFVRAIKVYETMNPLVGVEISYGLASMHWKEQRQILYGCLQQAKAAMDGLPPELYLDMNSPTGSVASGNVFPDASGYQYYPPAFPAPQPQTDIRHVLENQPMRRRLLQYEIQKANIYASQLATRSHFVERYLNLRDTDRERRGEEFAQSTYATANGFAPNAAQIGDSKAVAAAAIHHAATAAAQVEDAMEDVIYQQMKEERELIVRNLLVVITSLPQQHMEPNGASLINKIRQVASTLLNDAPDRKGPLAIKNEEYLARFLGILTRLEKTVPANGGYGASMGDYHGAMTPQDEEEELRNWADLREHQLRFANQGIFLTSL